MLKTIENLAKAFIGESQAKNRYEFYAKVARKEGFEQIGEIFMITAANEKEHAKRIFEHLVELCQKEKSGKKKLEEVIVQTTAPVTYGKTVENLMAAIKGERYEYTKMYPEFAEIAQKEGFPKIAVRLKSIAIAEKHHEKRYKKLLKEVKAGTVLKKNKPVWWVCLECGYTYYGKQPPKLCPSCDHAQGFYQVLCEKY